MLFQFEFNGKGLVTLDTATVNYEAVWQKLELDEREKIAAQRVMNFFNASHPDLKDNDHLKTRGELERIASFDIPSGVAEKGINKGKGIGARLYFDGKVVNKLLDAELLIRQKIDIHQPVYGLNPKKLYELSC